MNQFHFYEVSILSGNMIQKLQTDLVVLLNTTEAQQMNLQIQACALHLEYRRLKLRGENCKERLEKIQDLLRRNQYDILYYKSNEAQLSQELERLKERYFQVIFKSEEDTYRFFVP